MTKKKTEEKEYDNSVHSDESHRTSYKVDYYSVLKRRRRTAKDFLNEHDITSVGKLLNILHTLNARDYDISAEFVKDTMRIIEERKVQREMEIVIPTGPTEITAVHSNVEVVSETELKEKAKKKTKKTTKKKKGKSKTSTIQKKGKGSE